VLSGLGSGGADGGLMSVECRAAPADDPNIIPVPPTRSGGRDFTKLEHSPDIVLC